MFGVGERESRVMHVNDCVCMLYVVCLCVCVLLGCFWGVFRVVVWLCGCVVVWLCDCVRTRSSL